VIITWSVGNNGRFLLWIESVEIISNEGIVSREEACLFLFYQWFDAIEKKKNSFTQNSPNGWRKIRRGLKSTNATQMISY